MTGARANVGWLPSSSCCCPPSGLLDTFGPAGSTSGDPLGPSQSTLLISHPPDSSPPLPHLLRNSGYRARERLDAEASVGQMHYAYQECRQVAPVVRGDAEIQWWSGWATPQRQSGRRSWPGSRPACCYT